MRKSPFQSNTYTVKIQYKYRATNSKIRWKSPFKSNGNNKIDLTGDRNCVQWMKNLREENLTLSYQTPCEIS